MLVHRRVTVQHLFPRCHLYTWAEKGPVRVKCLNQGYNTTSSARLEPGLLASGTNHEATTPRTKTKEITLIARISPHKFTDNFYNEISFGSIINTGVCIIPLMLLISSAIVMSCQLFLRVSDQHVSPSNLIWSLSTFYFGYVLLYFFPLFN